MAGPRMNRTEVEREVGRPLEPSRQALVNTAVQAV